MRPTWTPDGRKDLRAVCRIRANEDELAGELLKLNEKEMQAHQRMWEKRGTNERAIQKANTGLRIEVDSILEG